MGSDALYFGAEGRGTGSGFIVRKNSWGEVGVFFLAVSRLGV